MAEKLTPADKKKMLQIYNKYKADMNKKSKMKKVDGYVKLARNFLICMGLFVLAHFIYFELIVR